MPEERSQRAGLPVHDRRPHWHPATSSGHLISSARHETDFEGKLQQIQNLKQRFNENRKAFSFPRFVEVRGASSWKFIDTIDIYCPALMAPAPNDGPREYFTICSGSEGGLRVHHYLRSLERLFLDLANVSYGPDKDVETRGDAVMDQIVKEIDTVEQWKVAIFEMASTLDLSEEGEEAPALYDTV